MCGKTTLLFFLFLLGAILSPVMAQSDSSELFKHIEDCALVVRLPSYENKIKALQKTIGDPNINALSKKRLTLQLQEAQQEAVHKNKVIVRTFKEHFTVLPLFFIYDTTHQLTRTVYLDEELQSIQVESVSPYIVQARFGRPLADFGNRPESIVLTDSHLKDLKPPFPKALPMTSIGFGINKLLAPTQAFERLLAKRVKKLNSKFEELTGTAF
ncbi:MAG: hypothetical protein KTR30_30415 [Saprospiraceae bacterium]|nr:hypothetical protein [Saprospiraceae bacterium]